MTLTTHRLCFSNYNNKGAWFLHHSNIHNLSTTGGGMTFKSPKLVVSTYALGDLLLCFRENNKLKDRDDCHKLFQKALDRKGWETEQRLQQKQRTSDQIASRKVGVDAILTKNALRHKEAAQLTESAFDGDAEDLLKEAAELVKIIQKYVTTLEHSGESTNSAEQAQLNDMMSNMGMASALSKSEFQNKRSDEDFYNILARQLADFLLPKLSVAGGVMTLTDVYCLYNRARGTNLISPDDLLAASSRFSLLKLKMSLRSFPSGVKVIQQDAFNDMEMAKKLQSLCQGKPITSMQVSRDLKIPSLLAKEQLLAAERLGYLCRDTTLETTLFYPNLFPDY
eukprot:CAMPEP_0178926666 /NCGR_PEP_ID=MMETSP0786-20121207/18681_1 /TAXON_ID=186022 /ORGANISM="Thalassionema frauenfeldii, Strain CCMP 1798" /LENGTH=337 /DNA_ID=CAMNT_0020601857 /DNA_START=87 /DNA_END=1100 /DNA_ORIENTATION=-